MTRGRWRRVAAAASALALLALATAAGTPLESTPAGRFGASSRDDERLEQLLIEVRVGRLLKESVLSYRLEGEALLPAGEFLRLVGMQMLQEDSRTAIALWHPGARRLEFSDTASHVLLTGRDPIPVTEDAVVSDGDRLYVSVSTLSQTLGLEIQVSWPDMRVYLVNPNSLPVVTRLMRDAARRAMARQSGPTPDLSLGATGSSWDGLVLDWAAFLPSSNIEQNGSFALGLGTNTLGGSLELEVRSGTSGLLGSQKFEGSWLGVWPEQRWLRQLRLGDGFGAGPRPRPTRGLLLSNSPYVRPVVHGRALFDGRVGSNWAVEAYQGGRLVAFDSTGIDGSFSFELPVNRGENPVDLVAYGPHGQVERLQQAYNISTQLLRDREFEYGISGGECLIPGCDAQGTIDLRYGISDRWTARAGAEQFWRAGGDLSHPYAGILGSPANSWTLELDGMLNGFARGRVAFQPSLNLRLAAEQVLFDSDVVDPVFTPERGESRTTLSAMVRPRRSISAFYLEGRYRRFSRAGSVHQSLLLTGSYPINALRVMPFVRAEHDNGSGILTSSRQFAGVDAVFIPRNMGRVLRQTWVQGGFEVAAGHGFTRINLNLSKTIVTGTHISAGIQWLQGSNSPALTFSLSSLLPGARLNSSVVAPTGGGPVTALNGARGSLIWNPDAGRVTFGPGPGLQRAGLTGTVFLDANANGLRDPGEEGIPDVRIIIGAQSVTTDSAGRYQEYEMLPFDPVLLSVDSLSLDNPLHVSTYGAVSVYPEANVLRVVDLPIVMAGVIDGMVRAADDAIGSVGGVTLELEDLDRGGSSRINTFGDGGFYLMGLRPGRYLLRVAPGQQWTAEPLQFTIMPLPVDRCSRGWSWNWFQPEATDARSREEASGPVGRTPGCVGRRRSGAAADGGPGARGPSPAANSAAAAGLRPRISGIA